jgi:hypothetical protein
MAKKFRILVSDEPELTKSESDPDWSDWLNDFNWDIEGLEPGESILITRIK